MIEAHGVLHVHSTYSHDGENSLEEIAEKGRSCGKQVVFMTEHTDDFQPELMNQFIRDCDYYSNDALLLIPGLEVTCSNGLHIMGIGLHSFVGEDSPDRVVERIHEAGGLAALSHPLKHGVPEVPKNIDFIEIWNGKCAGRVLPDFEPLKFFKKLRMDAPFLKGLAGLDLHHISQMANLDIVMNLSNLNQSEVLHVLEEGRYRLELGLFKFRPNGYWPVSQRILAYFLSCLVAIRDRSKNKTGLRIPSGLETLVKKLLGQDQ